MFNVTIVFNVLKTHTGKYHDLNLSNLEAAQCEVEQRT